VPAVHPHRAGAGNRLRTWSCTGALALLLPCAANWATAQQSRPAGGSATLRGDYTEARRAGFQHARQKARAWLDQLEVDAVELIAHNVKGIKKLAEILDAYRSLYQHSNSPADRSAVLRRVRQLAEQTKRDEYHALLKGSDQQFDDNSMSYLRVMYLMQQLGLDTSHYREYVETIKPRMDARLPRRGWWQREMFAQYYERFGLEWSALPDGGSPRFGILASRKPFEQYTVNDGYRLTHEIFVACEDGMQIGQQRLTPEDVAYLRKLLPRLLRRCVNVRDPDLSAELLSCMTYLGWRDRPVCRRAVDFLLKAQNDDGSWGAYEALRPRFGDYVEQHAYLHTTVVATRALIEFFEGNWPTEK
jgi:hypothetical protein